MTTASAKLIADLPVFRQPPGAQSYRIDRLGALTQFIQEPAPLLRLPLSVRTILVANSAEITHEVLVEKARYFEKSPVLRMALHPLAGVGLFTSEGELWRRQRKVMSPIFQPSQIKGFAADMTACATRTADTWPDGAELDIAHETTRIAMSVAGRTLFGEDMFDEADDLGEALTVALRWTGKNATQGPLLLQAAVRGVIGWLADRAPAPISTQLYEAVDAMIRPVILPGAEKRELDRALAVLERRVARMIDDRRRDPGRQDLLARLLAARDEEGRAMSDRQLRDEVLTLFIAGHETTAAALAWSLMLLCQHPEAYARARDEALSLPGVPAYDHLPLLGYCQRVFKESMRLYPPIFLFGRMAVNDVEIGGCFLPKWTIVLVSPYVLHRRPELWPNPGRFDPDRFSPEAESARPRGAYFPFSLGPRTCIGNHFALMEGPLVLATLLRRADFELLDPRGAEPDLQATLRPKGGVPMRVKLRRDARAA